MLTTSQHIWEDTTVAMQKVDLETWFIEQQLRIRQRWDRAVQRVEKSRRDQNREALQTMECSVIGHRVCGESHPGKRPIPTSIDDEFSNLR